MICIYLYLQAKARGQGRVTFEDDIDAKEDEEMLPVAIHRDNNKKEPMTPPESSDKLDAKMQEAEQRVKDALNSSEIGDDFFRIGNKNASNSAERRQAAASGGQLLFDESTQSHTKQGQKSPQVLKDSSKSLRGPIVHDGVIVPSTPQLNTSKSFQDMYEPSRTAAKLEGNSSDIDKLINQHSYMALPDELPLPHEVLQDCNNTAAATQQNGGKQSSKEGKKGSKQSRQKRQQ